MEAILESLFSGIKYVGIHLLALIVVLLSLAMFAKFAMYNNEYWGRELRRYRLSRKRKELLNLIREEGRLEDFIKSLAKVEQELEEMRPASLGRHYSLKVLMAVSWVIMAVVGISLLMSGQLVWP